MSTQNKPGVYVNAELACPGNTWTWVNADGTVGPFSEAVMEMCRIKLKEWSEHMGGIETISPEHEAALALRCHCGNLAALEAEAAEFLGKAMNTDIASEIQRWLAMSDRTHAEKRLLLFNIARDLGMEIAVVTDCSNNTALLNADQGGIQ